MPDVHIDDAAFQRGLAASIRSLGIESEKQLLKFAIRIENRAKQLCPVDTGRLRASIGHTTSGSGTPAVVVKVGTTVNYAGYVEYGTRYMQAQPFMRPGIVAAIAQGAL